jgi:hypothetical protein
MPQLREASREAPGFGSSPAPAAPRAPRGLQTVVVHARRGIPAGRAQLTDRLPVPPHAPSPQVTRLRAANADPGLGGRRQGDLSISYCTRRVTSLPD